MTRRKRPPLTRKREQYVSERERGLLVGEPLAYPAGVAERYRRDLDRLIKQMMAEYRREIGTLWTEYAPITQDASLASQAKIKLAELGRRFDKLFRDAAQTITDRLLGGVDKANAASLKTSLRELSGGVTLKTDVMPAALSEMLKASAYENVKLIRDIPTQTALRIEGAVMRSIQQGGEGRKTILDEVMRIEGMEYRRAKFIAEDQSRKIFSAMSVERSKALGIRKARWLHSRGGAVPRKKHVDFSGEIFDLDDPPAIGDKGQKVLPGTEPGCRCRYVPVLEWGQ